MSYKQVAALAIFLFVLSFLFALVADGSSFVGVWLGSMSLLAMIGGCIAVIGTVATYFDRT